MNYPIVEGARQNRILAGMPMSRYAPLSSHLKPVELSSGQVIFEADGPLDFVYFPTTCTASMVSQTQDGDSSELAMIGRDGMLGVPLALGSQTMKHRVMVQCGGQAYRMPAPVFLEELGRSVELQQLALAYVQALIMQMSQNIVCIGHHSVSERLCYWLLMNHDALPGDQLRVTHEMIANMLGVRRESVTQALGKLQAEGWVTSGRGKIGICDADGLAQGVCECYALVSRENQKLFDRLLDSFGHASQGVTAAVASSSVDGMRLQKYQDAYDFAPVGFVSLDAHCRIVQTNLAGAIMLGVQRSQTQAHDFLDFLSAQDRSVFTAFHQEVLSGKCRRHCELSLHGTERRSEMILRIEATLDEEGQECQLVLIDVTQERREAEQTLERERQQQEMLARQPYMLWFKDPQGHLISANSRLLENGDGLLNEAGLEKLDAHSMPWLFANAAPMSASPKA
ncbi:helix-turn-helix domain-containing protein [Limnohabitans lacus]|uniref:Helix-turn-helix domain-containing protein n=1 Tax=Limnohabitans lacus TaxID=3045173 RepID=A0ABT6X5B4_9BURK|nr:helix-turn-helix domain-containing protein [Limnohabitans sp. HM2-2]MDI9233302.1 helix-turn-helix domain-containing protein [Limnohabitans sp. HM2-2]